MDEKLSICREIRRMIEEALRMPRIDPQYAAHLSSARSHVYAAIVKLEGDRSRAE